MANQKISSQEEKNADKPSLDSFLHEIREKAHEVYIERMLNNEAGDDVSDWIKAETFVKKTHSL